MTTENGLARIGKTVVIRGEVKGSEDLIVDGHVEGTIGLAESRLTIGPTAHVTADLTAKDVLVLGQVQGNIVASGQGGSDTRGEEPRWRRCVNYRRPNLAWRCKGAGKGAARAAARGHQGASQLV